MVNENKRSYHAWDKCKEMRKEKHEKLYGLWNENKKKAEQDGIIINKEYYVNQEKIVDKKKSV